MNPKHPASAFMLFLAIWFMISSTVIGIGGMVIQEVTGIAVNMMVLVIISQLAGLLLPLVVWTLITGHGFKKHMPTQPMGTANYIYVIAISVLAIPGMMLVSGITSLFVTNDVGEFLTEASGTGMPWWLMMLAVAVTPGVIEELVFRGYVQSVTKGTVRKVILLNGLFFSIIHFNLHQAPYTFLLGVLFAYMVYLTKNIWAGIISHFIVNGINVSFAHWAMNAYTGTGAGAEPITLAQSMYDAFVETDPELAQRMYDLFYGVRDEVFAIVTVGIVAIFTTAIAIALLFAFIKHNKNREAMAAYTQAQLPPAIEDIPEDTDLIETPAPPEKKTFDWCFVALIIIYLALAVGLML